jgi:hypothetical protein
LGDVQIGVFGGMGEYVEVEIGIAVGILMPLIFGDCTEVCLHHLVHNGRFDG